MSLSGEYRDHYALCKTNCDEPLELINIVDADPEYECAHGHVSHECSCAEISANFYEAVVDAMESPPELYPGPSSTGDRPVDTEGGSQYEVAKGGAAEPASVSRQTGASSGRGASGAPVSEEAT
jgi:hypothetical protein